MSEAVPGLAGRYEDDGSQLAGDSVLQGVLDDAAALMVSIDCSECELSVLLCADTTIHRLNAAHRGIDRPTDVLSFAMQEGEGILADDTVLGDLVISVDTARRQALEHGHSLAQELRVLLVHGLLHLLGYDHETSDEDAAEMRAAEAKLLSRLGDHGDGLIGRVHPHGPSQ